MRTRTAAGVNPGQPARNHFLVGFKKGITAATRCTINAVYGCRPSGSIPGIDVQILKIPQGRTRREMLRIYRRNPHVEFAEPDYIARTALAPNDPYYRSHQENLHRMGAGRAWDITTGNRDIIVAVLDTGIMHGHPDLAGRVIAGYDFFGPSDQTEDNHGHGTGVAGVIGAATNNGRGIAGITWENPLLPVKVLGRTGEGNYSIIAAGIVYATERGARVINLSLGGAYNSQTLKRAVGHAVQKKALVVAAAGNSNGPVLYPAAYPDVMAVGAVDNNDERSAYSNYGPEISVTAPGDNIWSTTLNGGYRSFTGTSFAAPAVAGLAGLILSARPALTPSEVKQIIIDSAVDLGSPGWDKFYGWGRIQLGAALLRTKTR